jgi:hypothetical protein
VSRGHDIIMLLFAIVLISFNSWAGFFLYLLYMHIQCYVLIFFFYWESKCKM